MMKFLSSEGFNNSFIPRIAGFNNSLPPALRGGIKGGEISIEEMRAIRKRLPKSPPEIQRRAIELRSKSTDAERLIWSRLRTNRMNIKFRRQEPIGLYIVDFVSIDKGIIVELDGSQHYQVENRDYDAKRDKYLSSLGFEVLRFSDRDVMKDIKVVLSVIWEKIAPPLVPPYSVGGREGG